MQRERVKYKNLLANAQNDLTNTKLILDKENESKTKKDAANDHLIEENSKLVATLVVVFFLNAPLDVSAILVNPSQLYKLNFKTDKNILYNLWVETPYKL